MLLVFSAPIPGLAQEADFQQYKDPILAGALSWYVPGLGQFYGGSIFKGATFMVLEFGLLYGTIISVAEIELGVSGNISLGLKIRSKDGEVSSAERTTAIVLGTALIVVHFVNIIDAVNTTRKYNRELDQTVRPEIEYHPEEEAYRFGVSGNF
jgi:TM2 domain-containing membrane protein YozV